VTRSIAGIAESILQTADTLPGAVRPLFAKFTVCAAKTLDH
jgi:hypothetical protein